MGYIIYITKNAQKERKTLLKAAMSKNVSEFTQNDIDEEPKSEFIQNEDVEVENMSDDEFDKHIRHEVQ